MSTKSRKSTAPMVPMPEPQEVQDAPDLDPRGPVAHVVAGPTESVESQGTGKTREILVARLKLKRAEVLIAKGEAYSLASQIESLNREYQAKLGELQRAWDKTQRRVRALDAALEADESTLALLGSFGQ